jgi:hypothetical protein
MRFTGKNLETVFAALERAISDVNSQIGQCPNVFEFAADIAFLEAERAMFQELLVKVNMKLD